MKQKQRRMLSTSFWLMCSLVLSTSWVVTVRGQGCGDGGYEDAEVRKPNKAARERFEAAFPFLKGYNSSSDVWHVVSAEGDYVGELNCFESSGFRQGWGEMRWANGTLYGPGNIFIYSQGDRYFGQWIRDKQEGTLTNSRTF